MPRNIMADEKSGSVQIIDFERAKTQVEKKSGEQQEEVASESQIGKWKGRPTTIDSFEKLYGGEAAWLELRGNYGDKRI